MFSSMERSKQSKKAVHCVFCSLLVLIKSNSKTKPSSFEICSWRVLFNIFMNLSLQSSCRSIQECRSKRSCVCSRHMGVSTAHSYQSIVSLSQGHSFPIHNWQQRTSSWCGFHSCDYWSSRSIRPLMPHERRILGRYRHAP